MTRILLDQAGKKFRREWIFHDLEYQFELGNSYAITGPNGSGKSTLLQSISGVLPLSKGKLTYQNNNTEIPIELIYKEIIFVAPYMDLIEEFTLQEFLKFHFAFKPLRKDVTLDSILEMLFLTDSKSKEIKFFSSGMRQRLKLGLAFFSEVPVILLDEPTTNLDQKGVLWYHEHIQQILQERLVIIASNQAHEYNFCGNELNIPGYKKASRYM